jgi:hypothetical protein
MQPPAPPSYYSPSPLQQPYAEYAAEEEYDDDAGEDYDDDDDDYGSAKKKKAAKRSSAKRAGGRPKKSASSGGMRQMQLDPSTFVPPPIVTQYGYQQPMQMHMQMAVPQYTADGFAYPGAPVGVDPATVRSLLFPHSL